MDVSVTLFIFGVAESLCSEGPASIPGSDKDLISILGVGMCPLSVLYLVDLLTFCRTQT